MQEEISKETLNYEDSQFQAIEYDPDFNIATLKPEIGNIFQFFIPQHYLINVKSKIFGATHYSPESDLAAIAVHTGALFVHPKSKSALRRRFCTLKNFFEVQNCNESEYSKLAQTIDIPLDLTVKGVVLQILIDNSPQTFSSVQRNGLKSSEQNHPESYSLRVSNYFVISMYDDMPQIVPPEKYIRMSAAVPTFKFSFTREVGIVYKPNMFLQIFSRFNIVNGFFRANRLYFDDCKQNRYEIICLEGTTFMVVKYENSPTLNILKRKTNPTECGEIIIPSAEFSDFQVTSKGIIINKQEFSPLDVILIVPCTLEYILSNHK